MTNEQMALNYYNAGKTQTGKNPQKPDFVPKKIKLQRTVRSDWEFPRLVAKPAEYDVTVNQWGAVSVKINDEFLGIKPSEFVVIEWQANSKL